MSIDPESQRRQQMHTTMVIAAVLTLTALAALGLLYFAQPSILRNWGARATYMTGAVLITVQIIATGLGWRTAQRLRTSLTETQQRIETLAHVDQEGAQIVAELERRAAEQARLNRLVATLSAPLIPVTDQVVVVPLVGAVDRERVQHIRGSLLSGIEQQRARVALIDLTGAGEIAAQAIEPFIQLIAAVELMGCRAVLTGISTQVARSFLDRGIELTAETHRDVKAGLAYAADLIATSGRGYRPSDTSVQEEKI